MRTESILELSVDDLMTFFSKGRFVSVTFEKKNGELRQLTGRTGVTKYVTGAGPAYSARDYGQLRIFDVVNDGWRTITANKVKEVVADNVRYVVQ